ncbi:MAG: DUF1501 domain-containing protein [Gemmataceae bacterium]|nr:DUF1501 domain-containing protein [Gemmataceae bacterium]
MPDFTNPFRRQILAGVAGSLAASMLPAHANLPSPRGRVEHCIFIWLGGGMAQVDTFDPKRVGQPMQRVAGSAYRSIPTAVTGVRVTEYLPRLAERMDRVTAIRSIHHNVVDEHAAATLRVHTGRATTGTISYPSIGSIIAHERGACTDGVPAYVLIGYPNVSRGPGFLGPRVGYVYLTDTTAGPAGLTRPADISTERHANREYLLQQLRQPNGRSIAVQAYDQAIGESLRLSGPQFLRAFQLEEEAPALRERFGGEFGQRCLLARRLVERGVRFIEVSHNLNFINGTGWDTHNEGQLNQHLLIRELDMAVAGLIDDLEQRQLLDRTLIAIGTEFGRPSSFDTRGGRAHQAAAFSLVLAGGGLRHRGAYGATDDLCQRITQNPVSIPDFHATIYRALNIDPAKNLYDGSRPVPITDGGRPIAELFA